MWRTKSVVRLGGLVALASALLVGPANARVDDSAQEHCVVSVSETRESGELVLTKPVCFATFSAALAFGSGGTLSVASNTLGSDMFTDRGLAAAASTFTLGIHYDGYNGNGSSISVVGSNCGGGWWNTWSSWDNRISSSWNGCQRLRHYDKPNRGGSSASTYGAGTTDNLPGWMNNRTESISYNAS